MQEEYWVERWRTGQIGFHQGAPHPMLVAHHPRFSAERRIYVPLCGKANDLLWLRERGHDVIGVELVPEAIEQLMAEQALVPAREEAIGAFRWRHFPADRSRGWGRLDLLCGDALSVDQALFDVIAGGAVDVVYDRAALVALHPDQRAAYIASCKRVLAPEGHILLVTFVYDQSKLEGPPWSVDEATLRSLTAEDFVSETLAVQAEPLGPKFIAAGVSSLEERCVWLSRRAAAASPRPSGDSKA